MKAFPRVARHAPNGRAGLVINNEIDFGFLLLRFGTQRIVRWVGHRSVGALLVLPILLHGFFFGRLPLLFERLDLVLQVIGERRAERWVRRFVISISLKALAGAAQRSP